MTEIEHMVLEQHGQMCRRMCSVLRRFLEYLNWEETPRSQYIPILWQIFWSREARALLREKSLMHSAEPPVQEAIILVHYEIQRRPGVFQICSRD